MKTRLLRLQQHRPTPAERRRPVLGRTQVRVLRVVTLASAAGRYGGPFDTSLAQARLVTDASPCLSVAVVAGHLADDAPHERNSSELTTCVVRRVIPLPGFMGLGSIALFRAMWRGMSAANIVHISFSRELIPIVALGMAKLRRRRIILQPHGMLTSRSSWMHQTLDLALRPLARRVDAVIALTDREARELAAWFRKRRPSTRVIGNPVRLPLDSLTAESPSFRADEALWIARLHPRKRVAIFIEASRVAARNGWSERYVIIGPDEGDLPLVLEATRQGILQYEGVLPGREVPSRVARGRLFVLTADSEPWGNVLVTALALGVPAVVSASSALAGLVDRYGAGAVVDDGDAKGLADAVHRLLADSTKYGDAVVAARQLTREHLQNERVTRELIEIYLAAEPAHNEKDR